MSDTTDSNDKKDKNDNSKENDGLKAAATRLSSALQTFENTVAERRQGDLKLESLAEQVETLNASLSAEREKLKRMTDANDAVTEQIDEMITSIEAMLGQR